MYVRKNNLPHDVTKQFSALVVSSRLKALRIHFDVTQEKIAKIIGVDTSTYRKYEYGQFYIGIPQLFRLCQIYGVSANYLLGLTDNVNIKRLDKKKLEVNEEAIIERKINYTIDAWLI